MLTSYTLQCSQADALQVQKHLPLHDISRQQAHIWMTEVPEWLSSITRLKNVLSEKERMKAHTYLSQKDQQLYIISHGILRVILQFYTGIAPERQLFALATQGKPYLVAESATCFFNIAHSGQAISIAINGVDEIGIDIEKTDAGFLWQTIAQDNFHAKELISLQDKNHNRSTQLFYTYWTRKEAFLKAIGTGLTLHPADVLVLDQKNEIKLHTAGQALTKNREWKIVSFDFNNTYTGSIAYASTLSQPLFFNTSLLLPHFS